MSKVDEKNIKRHWHLVVFSVAQGGHLAPVSMYVWSKRRMLSVPELQAAKAQRSIPDGSVLVNECYKGFGTQYELQGTGPDPVPSRVSPAYLFGLQQAVGATDPTQVVNLYGEDDPYSMQEWQMGFQAGLTARANNPAAVGSQAIQE